MNFDFRAMFCFPTRSETLRPELVQSHRRTRSKSLEKRGTKYVIHDECARKKHPMRLLFSSSPSIAFTAIIEKASHRRSVESSPYYFLVFLSNNLQYYDRTNRQRTIHWAHPDPLLIPWRFGCRRSEHSSGIRCGAIEASRIFWESATIWNDTNEGRTMNRWKNRRTKITALTFSGLNSNPIGTLWVAVNWSEAWLFAANWINICKGRLKRCNRKQIQRRRWDHWWTVGVRPM